MTRHLFPLFPLLAAAALLATVVTPVAAQTDPAALLKQFIAAVNRNDVPAQLALLTEDVIFVSGPCQAPEVSGTCVGKAALQRQLEGSGSGRGAPTVTIIGTPQVSSNVATAREEERFSSFPPQLAAAGVERIIEFGTIVVRGDKIASITLVPDLSDPQTVTALRTFASLGPPPGQAAPPAASGPVAHDGQSLATQNAATQALFRVVWGEQAAARWVQEHNTQLAAMGR